MRTRAVCCILGLALGLVVAGEARAQVEIRTSVFSTAGGSSDATGGLSGTAGASDRIRLTSVVGQPSPVGVSARTAFALNSGYLYTIEARGLIVEVSPPAELPEPGGAVTITTNVGSIDAVTSVSLSYRPAGASEFTTVPMEPAEGVGVFQAEIPGEAVTTQGLVYFIEATDEASRTLRAPSTGVFALPVALRGDGLVRETPLPGGTTQTAYRLVSVPLELENPDPAAVLQDDLGDYEGGRAWRFFDLFPRTGQPREFPNTDPFAPGRGFWLITREEQTIDSGPGQTVRASEQFRVDLRQGWNLIGNPFSFPVPLDGVGLESGGSFVLWTYGEQGWQETTEPMQPFVGYALFTEASGDALLINPGVDVAAAKRGAERRFAWSMRVAAQAGPARDVDNVVAVSAGAAAGWDALDRAEPPVIGDYVSLAFHRPDWNRLSATYSRDVRPEVREGEVWTFGVDSNVRSQVRLLFDGLAQVPPALEVWLVDTFLSVAQDLRQQNQYIFADAQAGGTERFRIVVGTPAFARAELADVQTPVAFELTQNFPNPFSSRTTIRYGLPGEEHVTVKIYDLIGREIATLVDDVRPAGYHAVVWDGRTRRGGRAASGVYFVRLEAGSFTDTKKAVVVR